MEYTKEFIEEAIRKAEGFVCGNYACSLDNPTEQNIIWIACFHKTKFSDSHVVFMNSIDYYMSDVSSKEYDNIQIERCEHISQGQFLILTTSDNGNNKSIYGSFMVCKAALASGCSSFPKYVTSIYNETLTKERDISIAILICISLTSLIISLLIFFRMQ